MSVVFVTYILFQRPDIASAAEQDVSGTQEIWFDSSHSGWIIAMDPVDEYGIGSNTVNIEKFEYAGDAVYGSSGHLKYYIYAHERSNDYTGYIYFKVTCDERGAFL